MLDELHRVLGVAPIRPAYESLPRGDYTDDWLGRLVSTYQDDTDTYEIKYEVRCDDRWRLYVMSGDSQCDFEVSLNQTGAWCLRSHLLDTWEPDVRWAFLDYCLEQWATVLTSDQLDHVRAALTEI